MKKYNNWLCVYYNVVLIQSSVPCDEGVVHSLEEKEDSPITSPITSRKRALDSDDSEELNPVVSLYMYTTLVFVMLVDLANISMTALFNRY